MNRWLIAVYGGARLAAVITLVACAAQPEPLPTEPLLHLVFVGDVMLDDGPGAFIAEGGDVLADFAPIFEDADLSIANLECPIATGGHPVDKVYTFRAHPRVLPVLSRHFSAVSVANNHAGDYGRDAMGETLNLLKEAGIPYFGGGHNLEQAHAPLIVERKGVRIALLAYDGFKPRSFEALPDAPGVAWAVEADILADIRAARTRHHADLVIPFLHWGWEKEPDPAPNQRELARAMIDAGADIVIGGHPHVTQGAEYYKGHLIVYSLGNFVFDGFYTEETRTGWLLRLTVNRNGLVRWDTVAAHQDKQGVPHLMPGAITPCGSVDGFGVSQCKTLN